MNWIIHNIKTDKSYDIISDDFSTTNGLKILIDGYIIPRQKYYSKTSCLEQYELVEKLYREYHTDFVKRIKGVFTIVIVDKGKFYIFNDRHSIKKFFIYQDDNRFCISNQLAIINKYVKFRIDPENIALYCLMEHHIAGKTIFKNLNYSLPATQLIYEERISVGNYWKSENLYHLKRDDRDFDDFSENWKEIIKQYLEFLKPKKISMTLTGGNDSRMVLAALLKLRQRPSLFTFGNPNSFDNIVAQLIAKKTRLNFNNYFVEKPSKEWFNEYSNKIINFGNTMINIHRAHRLDAIEQEIKQNLDTEILFAGFMGGDYVKGIVYDDYITAKFLRLKEYSELPISELIEKILAENFVDSRKVNKEKIKTFLKEQPFISHSEKNYREFQYVYNVVGCLHDTQDSNIFNSKVKYIVNPFMDIDFLELLFSSKYSMLDKDNSTSNQIRRLDQSALHINITHKLAPELSDIMYAKKGYYSATEFLGNKFVLFSKRAFRHLLFNRNHAPSFQYQGWIRDFVIEQLNLISDEVKCVFRLDEMINSLNEDSHGFEEKYWHKFSNLINIDLSIKKYKIQ